MTKIKGHFDIVVIGAGPAALSFARAMRDSPLRICLLEQTSEVRLALPEYDGRDIALTHPSRDLLVEYGAWQRLKSTDIHLIDKACVINGNSSQTLSFDSQRKKSEALGFIVSNHLIKTTLYEAVKHLENVSIKCDSCVRQIEKSAQGYTVKLEYGDSFFTPLLIAADSRHSLTRRQVGIGADVRDFGRTAIACRMKHQKPHYQTAVEFFLYGCTVAILPLGNFESSVVVTANTDNANQLLALDDDQFCQFVSDRVQRKLGTVQQSSKRFSYPLVGVHARQFVKESAALIGDAAVGMHPVTAHGFNLGLSSANLLAQQIRKALDKNEPYYSEQMLVGYQRRHIYETRIMYHGTNALVTLFTHETIPSKFARTVTLHLSSLFPPIKWAIESKLSGDMLLSARRFSPHGLSPIAK